MSKGTLHCPHTTEGDLDPGIIWVLLSLEKDLGCDIRMTSGARCPVCNKAVGGEDNSSHLVIPGRKCMALDIDQSENPQIKTLYEYLTGVKNSPDRLILLKQCLKDDPGMHLLIFKCLEKGINRIGIGKRFFHIDTATPKTGHSANVCWMY